MVERWVATPIMDTHALNKRGPSTLGIDHLESALCETAAMAPSRNSFGAHGSLDAGGRTYEIFRLAALADRFDVARLPFC